MPDPAARPSASVRRLAVVSVTAACAFAVTAAVLAVSLSRARRDTAVARADADDARAEARAARDAAAAHAREADAGPPPLGPLVDTIPIPLADAPAPAPRPAPDPGESLSLRGVIKNYRRIAGSDWATVSLGADDRVTKGMRLKVFDPDRKDFLAYLTVDTVESTQSVGRLEGPSPERVRPNAEVRTRW
ncbi:MAG: hypothetical protein JWO31_363 [Phycisphaerales bacterium]|nr:hypothetical protein [Phycisphaerales bacterium]